MLWLVIVPTVHLGAFSILENKPIGYADDSTVMAVVPSPSPVTVAESMIRDFVRISELCDRLGMKFM